MYCYLRNVTIPMNSFVSDICCISLFSTFPSLTLKKDRSPGKKGRRRKAETGEIGVRSGVSLETTMDGQSFYNAFPTLTTNHHSTPHPPPFHRAKTFAISPWQTAFFCLYLPDSGWTQTKGTEGMVEGANKGKDRWMEGVKSINRAHLLSDTLPILDYVCVYVIYFLIFFCMVIQQQHYFCLSF